MNTERGKAPTKAAELPQNGKAEVDVQSLARRMCEAYARNSGNNLRNHFDTVAAVAWMAMALMETGVAELIAAAQELDAAQAHYDAIDAPGGKRTDRLDAARNRLRAALAQGEKK